MKYIWVIDKVWGQNSWILVKIFLCVFMERDKVEVHKRAKKKYPAILTEQTWSITGLLYGFRGNFSCGTQRLVPSEQDPWILTARVANHSARFGSSWWSEWRLSPGQHEWYHTLGENNKTNSRNIAPSPQKTTAALTWVWLWLKIELQAYNKCCSSNEVIETGAKVWVNNEYWRN